MDAKMTKSIKAVQLATASMTKFAKVPANETGAMTATRSASLAAAVEKRKQAEAHETQEVGLVYDLFHKLTVYTVDAAERQRFYIMCNLRKPAKSSIRSHVTRMETLNPSDLEEKNLYCITICILHAYCTSQYAYCDKKIAACIFR